MAEPLAPAQQAPQAPPPPPTATPGAPPANLAAAVAKGEFVPDPETDYPVIAPDGTPGTVKGIGLAKAIQLGYMPETAQEQAARLERAKYGQGTANELAAGAAGLARGATLGLSDLALTKSGAVDPETLRLLEKYNRGSSAIGEGVGAVAPFLVGGPLGEILGAPMRGVAALGRGAAGLTEGALAKAGLTAASEGLGARLVARALPGAVGSAIEGALYGGGQAISESSLGDTDLTAEQLMTYMGMGALLGGGLGAGLAGAGGLAEAALGKTKGMGQALGSMYERATGAPLAKGVGEAAADTIAKVSSVLSGGDQEAIARLLKSPELRAAAVGGEEVRDQAIRKLANHLDRLENVSELLEDQAVGEGKIGNIRSKVAKDTTEHSIPATQELLGNIDQTLKGMAAEPGIYGEGPVKLAGKLLKDYSGRIERAIAEGGEGVNAKIYTELDQFKRQLGSQKLTKFGQHLSFADNQAAMNLQRVYDEQLRPFLEDQKLWGRAGEAQEAVNRRWYKYLQRSGTVQGDFLRTVGRTKEGAIRAADPEKIGSFINNLTRPANDLRMHGLQTYLDDKLALLDDIGNHFDLPQEVATKISDARQEIGSIRKTLDEVQDKVVAQNQLRELTRSGHGVGSVMGGLGGAAIAGAPGAVIGGAISALANPAVAIRQLAAMERMAGQTRRQVADAISGFISKSTAKGGGTARQAAIAGTFSLYGGYERSKKEKPQNIREAFHRRADEVMQLASNPQAVNARIAHATQPFAGAAPQISAHMAVKTGQGVQFLNSKLPKDPRPPTMPAFGKPWEPSDAEISQWERYVRAVDNPLSVLQDMKKGTLTYESVEAVRTVYPKLYAQIQQELTAQVAKLQTQMRYSDRLQLALLFDAPLDPTLDPGYIAAIQKSQATPAQPSPGQGQPAGPRMKTSPLAKSNRPSRLASFAEQTEGMADHESG